MLPTVSVEVMTIIVLKTETSHGKYKALTV